MRNISMVLLCSALLTLSSQAGASVLSNRLTFDGPVHHTLLFGNPFQGGGEDKLQDDSLSALIDFSGGTDPYAVGNVVYGLINMTNTLSSGVGNLGISQLEQITIVFSAKIVGPGSGGSVALGPIGDSTLDWDLRNFVSPSILNDFSSGPDDNSIFIVMSNPIGTAEVGGINPLTLNANIGASADANSIINNITNANGWTGDAIGGLLSGDFFEFLSTGGLSGIERGGFSIQEHNLGGGVVFLPVDVKNTAGTISYHDVTLDIATVNIAETTELSKGWLWSDQGTFYVNAYVPEPGTMMVWSALCGLAGAAIHLKRRS